MAFPSGSRIQVFDTLENLDDTSSAVADDAFSVAGDLLVFTNTFDGPTSATVFSPTYSIAPDTNSSVLLFAQALNIDGGTGDAPTPSKDYLHDLVGSIPVVDITSIQHNKYAIILEGVKSAQEYQFYIWNRTGQSIPAGWTIRITPTAIGIVP